MNGIKFSLVLRKEPEVTYFFEDNQYRAFDLYEDEPYPISAIIELEDGKEIGQLSGYYLYNDNSFFERCNNVSAECSDIAKTICRKSGSVSPKYLSNADDQIFILDRLEVDVDYRGKGIASSILANLSKILRYQFDFGSTIFLCASDYIAGKQYGFNSTQYNDNMDKLIRLYTKCGYKVIDDNILGFWSNDK